MNISVLFVPKMMESRLSSPALFQDLHQSKTRTDFSSVQVSAACHTQAEEHHIKRTGWFSTHFIYEARPCIDRASLSLSLLHQLSRFALLHDTEGGYRPVAERQSCERQCRSHGCALFTASLSIEVRIRQPLYLLLYCL
jgi:hypothetical protein